MICYKIHEEHVKYEKVWDHSYHVFYFPIDNIVVRVIEYSNELIFNFWGNGTVSEEIQENIKQFLKSQLDS